GGRVASAAPALAPQLALPCAPSVIVRQIEGPTKLERVVAPVISNGYAVAIDVARRIRHLFRLNEVLGTQLGRIHPQPTREPIEEPLDHEHRLGPARPAIRSAG